MARYFEKEGIIIKVDDEQGDRYLQKGYTELLGDQIVDIPDITYEKGYEKI